MLAMLINRNALESLAGGTAFQRGEEYFAAGVVSRLRAQDSKVSANLCAQGRQDPYPSSPEAEGLRP